MTGGRSVVGGELSTAVIADIFDGNLSIPGRLVGVVVEEGTILGCGANTVYNVESPARFWVS